MFLDRILTRRRAEFIFGIPLIPRHRARDWQTVVEKLGATLRSALNQTDSDFHIIIAAEEALDLPETRHEKVTVLRLKGRRPPDASKQSFSVAMFDLWFRRNRLTKEAKRWRANHVMFLDADDLVSNRLVETIKAMPPASGYALTKGFVMDDVSGNILPCPSPNVPVRAFDYFCGSGLIFSLAHNPAFPKPWPDVAVNQGHHKARDFLDKTETPMMHIEIPLAIYVLNTGMNVSSAGMPNGQPPRDAHALASLAVRHGRKMTPEEKQEFLGV